MSVTGPIPDFLNKVSRNWGLTFVYPKIWTVRFLNRNNENYNLIKNIGQVLGGLDNVNAGGWDNDFNKLGALINNSSNIYKNLLTGGSEGNPDIYVKTNNIKHFILATKISTPSESVYIGSNSYPTNLNGGGAIWGHFAGGRENSAVRTIDITFLDTYREFTEYIIRPWIVAVAHQGLIESSEFPCIKCDIVADFYAKSAPQDKTTREKTSVHYFSPVETTKTYTISKFKVTQPFLRKSIRFFNCVPMKLPEKNYNFAPDISSDEAMTTITFAYDYYQVLDPYNKPDKNAIVTTEGVEYYNDQGENLIDVSETNSPNNIEMSPDQFQPTTNNRLT